MRIHDLFGAKDDQAFKKFMLELSAVAPGKFVAQGDGWGYNSYHPDDPDLRMLIRPTTRSGGKVSSITGRVEHRSEPAVMLEIHYPNKVTPSSTKLEDRVGKFLNHVLHDVSQVNMNAYRIMKYTIPLHQERKDW